jgi:ABC-type uncharacterized transport system substrate-binding protein
VAAGAFGFLTSGARIAVGQNIVIDLQAGGDVEAEFLRSHARDLMAKGPDIVLGAGGTIVAALQRASRTVPIVFVAVTDPVGGGLVASLAHPQEATPLALHSSNSVSARNG